ncbi:MAG: hypothetical protein GY851_23805 [bacterium]|nr:hypothetical protein [bacterium]
MNRSGSSLVAVLLLHCLCVLTVAAEDPNPPTIRSTSGAWPIRRQWTPAETQHYARWVEHIYLMKTKGSVEQRIGKLERVLTDPEMNLLEDPAFAGEGSNPQLPKSLIRSMHHLMDCGKFTAFVPAYYAYRRALPWMTTSVRSGKGDIRTSPYNIPVRCVNSFTCGSPSVFFRNAVGCFISGNYRVNIDGKNAHLSDTVPVALNRRYLLPGCINYIDGHCLVLARVSEYGELHFLNCSTARTRDIFSYNGMNVVSGITPRGYDPDGEWNGCFQGLRVLRYPIAITNSKGRVIDVRRRTDEEMVEFGFSTEQYDIIREIYINHYITEGDLKPESFHDLIRLRMKTVDSLAPLKFMEEYVDDLLDAYVLRERFVQDGWRHVQAKGWITYPEERRDENIFQAKGRWETWSSPSSDVDRRNKYFYLADWIDYAIRLYGLVPTLIDLTGLEKYEVETQSDLAEALIAEKNRLFADHSMEYANTPGEKISMTLLDIEQRLYDLSFDPNHPPELRWGAPMDSDERASAPKTYTPLPNGMKIPMEDAYRWEAYYRSLGMRETDMSCLRGMFTTGYPIRAKLDAQVGRWIQDESEIVEEVVDSEEAEVTESAETAQKPEVAQSEEAVTPEEAEPVQAPPTVEATEASAPSDDADPSSGRRDGKRRWWRLFRRDKAERNR